MKYIKKFNEEQKFDEAYESLKKLCNDSLVYLLDDGFELSYSKIDFSFYTIKLSKGKVYDSFNWYQVKEDIIPLLEFIKEKYDIVQFFVSFSINGYPGTINYNVDELISKDQKEEYETIAIDVVTMYNLNLQLEIRKPKFNSGILN